MFETSPRLHSALLNKRNKLQKSKFINMDLNKYRNSLFCMTCNICFSS